MTEIYNQVYVPLYKSRRKECLCIFHLMKSVILHLHMVRVSVLSCTVHTDEWDSVCHNWHCAFSLDLMFRNKYLAYSARLEIL